MKKYINNIALFCAVVSIVFGAISCEKYLDRTPDADISPDQPFKNFVNFQGFTEELYYCIPDFAKGYWTNSFNWGEDEIMTTGVNYHMGYKIDVGDFWGWQSEHDGWQAGWMDRRTNNTTNDDRFNKSLWKLGWYGIRKANMGLENMDKFTEGTQEERDLVKGQLLFFRGWFHFMFMQYFGGLPYIDKVLPSDEKLKLPRLSYQQCAELAAADFRAAADLLPVDWDKTTTGIRTSGKNQLRINKIMALGYLGKNYLFAASPLMNFESKGVKSYDPELAKKAAAAFAELLNITESGNSQYRLVEFEKYSTIFYTNGQGWKMPGEPEAIFRGPSYDPNGSNWGLSKQYQGQMVTGQDAIEFTPTANYVSYYGMANGLPIPNATQADAESGYDPEYPWRNRDPRFYHDICFDGKKCVIGTLSAAEETYRYANLYTGGNYRDVTKGSRTGYTLYKFIPVTANKWDKGFDYGFANHIHLSYMRLADIYLMYAEAVLQGYGSPTSSDPTFSKTALDAINTIRERAGAGRVAAKFTASKDLFMGEIIRERAVELAYEGHRFNDLRRWLLLTEKPYTLKTSHEFDRAGTFNTTDPTQNRVVNMKEVVLVERKFTSKHYWLPLKNTDVTMYLEFAQNPGW